MATSIVEIPLEWEEGDPDPGREARLFDEIIVDAYGEEEVVSSWYYYLQEALNFPFTAMIWTHQPGSGRSVQPVRIMSLAPMSRCGYWQMWAMGALPDRPGFLLHFFLSDIAGVEPDPEREQALTDWSYWRRNEVDEMWEE